jgi:hypothetical protein
MYSWKHVLVDVVLGHACFLLGQWGFEPEPDHLK